MLEKGLVQDVLDRALQGAGDFAELFVEETLRTTIQYSSNEVEKALAGKDYGAGIRIFLGSQSVYAYTNDLSREGLLEAAATAAQAGAGPTGARSSSLERLPVSNRHPVRVSPRDVVLREKVELIESANRAARAYHELISQVQVSYLDEVQRILVANSEGVFAQDERVRTRLHVVAVASSGQEMQMGAAGPGACQGFEFYQGLEVSEVARRAAEVAVTMLRAEYAPSGKMPVIIDKGFGGVIFHEACGHGLEGYGVSKKASVFADKLGREVAGPLVSVVDDGTLANLWGSTNIDDEGTPTERTLLIDRGALRSFMVDKLSGRILGLKSTGSGRRQSYRFAPVSRMRNTFILPGPSTLEEMIEATPEGLYARKMGGGSVNPATGDFNFAVMEGYLIRGGKLDRPVRGATLIGNGKDILWNIDLVGDDLQLEPGVCGATSGSVPTTVGQPPIRVQGLVVGGRS